MNISHLGASALPASFSLFAFYAFTSFHLVCWLLTVQGFGAGSAACSCPQISKTRREMV
jgi:hypothetical protein